MFQMKVSHLIIFIILLSFETIKCDKKYKNKYSKESNTDIFNSEKYDPEIRELKNPFRMGKLNLVWEKAKHRLTEPKLKSLYTELKIQDKEEIAWKELNSQHKDKDGVKADELRHKLMGIMSTYDLLEHFDDSQDPVKTKPYRKFHEKDNNYLNKSLFKDKKLNRLWEKAEISGFEAEELKTLREEFQHHQEKIDLYYTLLEEIGSEKKKTEYHENAVNEDELEIFNEVANLENNEIPGGDKRNDYYSNNVNKLRDTHREIKDHFERLERLTARGPNSQEFIEPKVQGLWRVAQASNFTENELISIKQELRHFEARLLKLRHLHADYALTKEKHKDEKTKDKHDKFVEMNDHIKKQTRKVEKLQDDIERIIFKHTEL